MTLHLRGIVDYVLHCYCIYTVLYDYKCYNIHYCNYKAIIAIVCVHDTSSATVEYQSITCHWAELSNIKG